MRVLLAVVVAAVVVTVSLGACTAAPVGTGRAETQPDAIAVLEQLGPLGAPGEFTDEAGACRPQGCVEMLRTEKVTISQWMDAAAALRWQQAQAGTGDVRPAGRFVLAFVGGQQSTPPDVRSAWTRRAQELSAVG